MKLSVIIPVYNERENLLKVIEKVEKVPIEKEIIAIDDCSTDGSREILKNLENRIKVIYHSKNQGKGMAIRSGLKRVSGDLVIIQDADLEYNPQDYLKLLPPIMEGKAEVVYGSRFLGEPKNFSFLFYWGNRFLTLITNLLYGSHLTDMETCYKLFKTRILKNLNLKAKGFEFEPEITAKLLRRHIPIYEAPISYQGRRYSGGKKITWRDGFPALWTLIKYRFIKG